jgi:hypothetical protein
MPPVYPPGWQGPGKPLKPPTPPTPPTPKTPTSNFNFTTAGTGAMGAIKFNFGTGNPFGPGLIMPNPNIGGSGVGGYEWVRNTEQQFAMPVVLIGDKTGKYISSALPDSAILPGSPISMQEAVTKIMTDTIAKPGGILALKQKLHELQYYDNSKIGQMSLDQQDALDGEFYKALTYALNDATAKNGALAAQQGDISNPKILTFEDFLSQAPKTGFYTSSGGGAGSGGRQTSITRQKFKPEDFEIAIDQLFQQTVGRGASEDELTDFVAKLQNYEKKNPQKTVSVKSGNTTKTTQSGGVSSDIMQKMMRDEALDNPEAENYNKATKYLSYFMEALDNPIELG